MLSNDRILSMAQLKAKQTQVIILLGPPGAGKGSQAALIKKKMSVAHISTGDLLRENIKRGTALGQKVKSFMNAGQLVPDELILDMLFARVEESDCQKGYILDGFPRNISQAIALQKRLSKGYQVVALNLKVSDDKIVDRITQRVICKSCQAPYHLAYSPPKTEGKCDQCEGSLYQRSDDTKEVVEKRLTVYHEQTAPLIDYYKEKSTLHQIDSTASKEAVLLAILRIIKNKIRPIDVD